MHQLIVFELLLNFRIVYLNGVLCRMLLWGNFMVEQMGEWEVRGSQRKEKTRYLSTLFWIIMQCVKQNHVGKFVIHILCSKFFMLSNKNNIWDMFWHYSKLINLVWCFGKIVIWFFWSNFGPIIRASKIFRILFITKSNLMNLITMRCHRFTLKCHHKNISMTL